MKINNIIMWLMFLVTSIVSVITMVVSFGMVEYSRSLKLFMNFLPLEICLSATLFLWGLNNLYNNYSTNGKKNFFYYVVMSSVLLVFIFQGVY